MGSLALQQMGLVLFSSLLLVNISKVATSDTWLLAFQLLSFVFLIRYIKQDQQIWLGAFLGMVLLGLFIAPLMMMIWAVLLCAFLYRWHPRGQKQPLIYGLLALSGIAGIGLWTGLIHRPAEGFFLGYGHLGLGAYSLAIIGGLIPILGFLPAAIWDMVQKFRKGEELSIIVLAGILAAALSQSLMLEVFLVLAIAKQMSVFLPSQLSLPRANPCD